MKQSIDEAPKQNALKAMTTTDISQHKTEFYFPGIMVYFTGLLKKHADFDCSARIIKFEQKVQYNTSNTVYNLGMQLNLVIDRANNQIILRASQGENANHFYAVVGLNINYDFNSNKINNYFLFLGDFNDTYSKVTSGYCYSYEDSVLKVGNYEDCEQTVDDLMKPYIDLIPSATLIEGEESRTYMLDYCSAIEYAYSLTGSDSRLKIVE